MTLKAYALRDNARRRALRRERILWILQDLVGVLSLFGITYGALLVAHGFFGA